MTRHYSDLGSASDWMKQISPAVRPIRTITQISVVTCHQYGISALVSQTSFRGETSGGVAKCRLFSQSISLFVTRNLYQFQCFFYIPYEFLFVICQHYQNKNIAKHEQAVLHFQSLFAFGRTPVSGHLTLKSQFGHIVSGLLQ